MYDLIILGTGTMGSSVCYHAAKAGLNVLGLDQFKPPHKNGSHSGGTRIIRQAYFEHPNYVPLLHSAYEGWNSWENEAGKTLFHKCGLAYGGEPESELISGVLRSVNDHQLNIEPSLGADKEAGFDVPGSFKMLFEKNAGFAIADESIETVLELARKQGCDFQFDDRVVGWELRNGHVEVYTKKEVYKSRKIVITSGAYSGPLIPKLRRKVEVTRQKLFWFEIDNSESFQEGKFPCWCFQDPDYPGLFYGFPYFQTGTSHHPRGLKIAYHYPGEIMSENFIGADHVETPYGEELVHIEKFIDKYLRLENPQLVDRATCFYSNSPDKDFIIDFLPGTDQKVVFAAGFSGHGFKFAPVIGKIVLDLTTLGNTGHPIDFLRLGRFSKTANPKEV
ncbi:MAG: N-methyl-L-tryptophan oxidase [Saprospiraceae bacterium]|nr:N-methyl-L-tryptophan oxidase [Saprospiraceae bacterium]